MIDNDEDGVYQSELSRANHGHHEALVALRAMTTRAEKAEALNRSLAAARELTARRIADLEGAIDREDPDLIACVCDKTADPEISDGTEMCILHGETKTDLLYERNDLLIRIASVQALADYRQKLLNERGNRG